MEQSILYSTHLALSSLLFDHKIWNIYAYIPSKYETLNAKWKIKTKKYDSNRGVFSFDSLKHYDPKDEQLHPIVFNFGFRERKKISGLRVPAIHLEYEYDLEREIVERICQLSDTGHVITSHKEVILDKFKGSEFLIGIDMAAPSYSHLDIDKEIDLPF